MSHQEQKLSYGIESDSKTYERQKRTGHKRALGILAVVLATTIAGGVAIGCSAGAKAPTGTNIEAGSPSSNKFGEIKKDIVSVSIDDGARLRKDPWIPDEEDGSNIIIKSKESFTVFTKAGVTIKEDEANGNWYGVPQSDFTESAKNSSIPTEVLNSVKSDKDGLIWISSQKASVQSKTDKIE